MVCIWCIHTMCVLFVCLYIAAHCRTPECKSVRPDWSFRTLLRSSSVSTIVEYYSVLNEHYRSTTPCSMSTTQCAVCYYSMPIPYNFSVHYCPLLNEHYSVPILNNIIVCCRNVSYSWTTSLHVQHTNYEYTLLSDVEIFANQNLYTLLYTHTIVCS